MASPEVKPILLRAFLLMLLAALPFSNALAAERTNNFFIDTVASNFFAWDLNHDQTLSRRELDAAIADPANTGRAAAALAALKRGNVPPPWTLDGLRRESVSNGCNLMPLYGQALRRIRGATNRLLYASGLPKLNTIHQGRMGNCYCLAPLGAMLNRNPQDVSSLFEVQQDGQILAKFAGGAMTIAPLTDAEIALTAGNSRDGVWINLFEKAMGEARNERLPATRRARLAIDAIAYGGSPQAIMSYLTGHKVNGLSIKFGDNPDAAAKMDELRRQLEDATRQKRLMACSTDDITTPGLTPHHAYAVLEFNSQSDSLKIWNPHGNNFTPKGPPGLSNGYPTTNGTFSMPLADFPDQFEHVFIERTEPTTLQWLDEWELLAQSSRFQEAADDLSEVIELDPSAMSQYVLGALLIQCGKIGEYNKRCHAMLDQFEKSTNPSIAERTAKSCLLLPSVLSADDLARAADLAARGVSLSKEGDRMHWRLMTRGLAEYRQGRCEEAIKTEPLAVKEPADSSRPEQPFLRSGQLFHHRDGAQKTQSNPPGPRRLETRRGNRAAETAEAGLWRPRPALV